MTTYQDQPLSWREIREREAEAARAAEAAASHDEQASGDSNAPVTPDAAPEPLNYVTQGRAPLPHYDTPVAQPTTPPATPSTARCS